jgi:hypothetical protein
VESRYLLKSGHYPNQNTLYSRSSTQSNNSTSKATHSAPSCDRRRRVFSPSPEACAEWLSGGEEKGSPPSSAQSLLLASTWSCCSNKSTQQHTIWGGRGHPEDVGVVMWLHIRYHRAHAGCKVWLHLISLYNFLDVLERVVAISLPQNPNVSLITTYNLLTENFPSVPDVLERVEDPFGE